jgi:hypothetical protein
MRKDGGITMKNRYELLVVVALGLGSACGAENQKILESPTWLKTQIRVLAEEIELRDSELARTNEGSSDHRRIQAERNRLTALQVVYSHYLGEIKSGDSGRRSSSPRKSVSFSPGLDQIRVIPSRASSSEKLFHSVRASSVSSLPSLSTRSSSVLPRELQETEEEAVYTPSFQRVARSDSAITVSVARMSSGRSSMGARDIPVVFEKEKVGLEKRRSAATIMGGLVTTTETTTPLSRRPVKPQPTRPTGSSLPSLNP